MAKITPVKKLITDETQKMKEAFTSHEIAKTLIELYPDRVEDFVAELVDRVLGENSNEGMETIMRLSEKTGLDVYEVLVQLKKAQEDSDNGTNSVSAEFEKALDELVAEEMAVTIDPFDPFDPFTLTNDELAKKNDELAKNINEQLKGLLGDDNFS